MITIHNKRYENFEKLLEATLNGFSVGTEIVCQETIKEDIATISVCAIVNDSGNSFIHDAEVCCIDQEKADDAMESIIKNIVAEVLTFALQQEYPVTTPVYEEDDGPGEF